MKPPLHSNPPNLFPDAYDPQRFRHSRLEAHLTLLSEAETEPLGILFADQDPWARLRIQPDQLRAYFRQHEEWAPRYGIRIGERIAGVVGLRLNWLKGPYLQFLGLDPNFQNLGLGSAALCWLIEEARRHKEANVWVCASSFNQKALSFYERNGFLPVAHLQGLVVETEDEILLRLRL